jgi:hypothetical protein
MKATELRIGNYYQYAGDNGIIYTQVKEIKYNQFGLLGDFDGTNFEICKPIPLTEEWLLKFGFENLPTDEPFFKRHKIEVFKFSKGNFFLLGGNNTNYGIGLHNIWQGMEINIQHVHELQNLYFALTGEELSL